MGRSRVGSLVASVLIAVMLRPAAGDSCAEDQRDERGKCPPKVTQPSQPPPVKKTELDIQGPDVLGARVVLDGQAAGYAPLTVETTPGRHRIELHKEGYVPYSESVDAKQAQRVKVVVKLQPAPRAPTPTVEQKQARCPEGMVHVPAAKLQKGDGGETGNPGRAMTVAGFCIDKTEVTVKAYAACVAAKGCAAGPRVVTDPSSKERKPHSLFCNQDDRPDHPVNCVSWDEAVAYCKWAGKRLPTRDDWRYAAQGEDGRPYPWGNDPPSARRLNACGTECVAMVKRVLKENSSPLYKASDGWETTAPSGMFPGDASPFGVLDMAGNVSEWTDTRSGLMSTICGGNWAEKSDWDVRVDRCDTTGVKYHYNYIGFRCARDE